VIVRIEEKMKRIALVMLTITLAGCGAAIESILDRSNTLCVRNRSGEDLPKLVVMKDSHPLTFTDLNQLDNYYKVLLLRQKQDITFGITVHFPDGQTYQTNRVVTLEPNPLRQITVNVLSNRVVEIMLREK